MEIAFRTFTTMPSLCIDLRSASSLDHKIIKGDYVGMRKVICCRKLYDKCRHYTFFEYQRALETMRATSRNTRKIMLR